MSKILVDTIDTRSGTSNITIGSTNASQITLKSGATLTNFPDNTPRWGAYIGSDQTGLTNNVITKGAFNTEHFDSDGAFDTSNYRFTVPSGKAGVYYVTGFVTFEGTSGAHGRSMYSWIYKNGGGILRPGYFLTSQYFEGTQGNATSVTGIFDLSAGDYLELYGQKYDNGGVIKGGSSLSYFGGYKLS